MIDALLDFVDGLLSVLEGLDPLLLALGVAAFTALETTALIGLVVPGDAAVLLAGSTVSHPARFPLMVAAAAGGSYAGELAGYGLGRLVGPRLRRSWFGRRLGEQRWTRAETYLGGRGAPALVPARFVSVVHAVAPLVAGTVRMPLRTFALWAGLGALLWGVVYVSIGTAAGAAYREFRGLGLLMSAIAIAGSMVALAVHRWRSRRRAARTRAAAGEDTDDDDTGPDPARSGSGRDGRLIDAAKLSGHESR